MGWDVDRFSGEIDSELVCCICTGVLEDPVESPCGNDTTLFQPSVDVSQTYVESNRASDDCGLCDIIHIKYMNSFYSAI